MAEERLADRSSKNEGAGGALVSNPELKRGQSSGDEVKGQRIPEKNREVSLARWSKNE